MKKLSYIFVLFAIVFGLWIFYPAVASIQRGLFFNSDFGVNEFGDMYGSLNTLFSGLAFSGVIISIFLQSAELKATREEMKAQVVQFEQQTEAMQKQVFESSFFSMINLHNTISSNLRNENKFEDLFRKLVSFTKSPSCVSNNIHEHLRKTYDVFMAVEYSSIGHYFRYVYQIMKFINGSSLNANDKVIYMNILRAQLSNYELMLLFVNCQCYKRSDKFRKLVEEYGFFEHIYDSDLKLLLNAMNEYKGHEECYQLGEMKMLYSPKAFGLECQKD
ncbi:putative phage abortive infection protein [Aeromonas sobria]|uniref:putative phage abortive infection protein n=1 Tax=Aeromonas sobria TaxID=646 RepID=UPI003F404A81